MKTTRNEQMSRLFLLHAIGGVLFVATPCAAGVTPCRFDGVRCTTNQDCCSGVCTGNVCAVPHCQAFPATGQTMCWDSSAASIPCAGTGQDGDFQKGAPLSYADNGDGTITDNNTSLVWEKLSMDGSVHDVGNRYTWDQAFSVHVAKLNSTRFAGHADWRVPNVRDLLSIVNYAVYRPAVSAAFNTGCTAGCTVLMCSCTGASLPSGYWSSTTFALFTGVAWAVDFDFGLVLVGFDTNKPFYGLVRAVRGGS